MRRTCSTVVMMVFAVLVAAGCGGDARADYEQGLLQVGASIDAALDAIPTDGAEPVSAAQLAQLATDVEDAAEQLEELDPPEQVRRAQTQMEQALRAVATAYEELAQDLRDAVGRDEISEVFVAFATDEKIAGAFDDLETAQAAFDDAGFRVFEAPAAALPAAPAADEAGAKAKADATPKAAG